MPYPHDLSARALFAPKTVVAPLLSAAPADYFSSAHPYPFGRAAAGYLLKKHAKKRAFGSQWGRRYVRIDRHSGTLVYGRRADDAPMLWLWASTSRMPSNFVWRPSPLISMP